MKEFFLIYMFINLLSFILMKTDKQRAKKQQWRIPEFHLWTVSLLGGALGGWIAMRMFRHKTKHISFRYGLPLLTIVQIALIIYFLLGLT